MNTTTLSDREKGILEMCSQIIEMSPKRYYNPNGADESTCPLCESIEYGLDHTMSSIRHKPNCAYLIAKGIMPDKDIADKKRTESKRITEMAITFLSKRNPFDDVSPTEYSFLLMEFQENKGDEAIEGLAGFYIYAINHFRGEKQHTAIKTTFAHDLNGRNEKSCEPKTSSYRQVWLNEVKKMVRK